MLAWQPRAFVAVVDDVFSAAECDALLARCEDWHEAALGEEQVVDTTVRKCKRCFVDDPPLAEMLWERVHKHVPERGGGRMRAVGLNPRLRVLKYGKGDFFAPHYDGSFVLGEQRSLVTLMLYLSDGGALTRFINTKGGPDVTVQPKKGRVLLFDHAILHAGDTQGEGTKCVARTDVMFVPTFQFRTPPPPASCVSS